MKLSDYNGFSGEQRQRSWDWQKRQTRPELVACMACGQTQGELMEHSEDYSEPFGPHLWAYQLCRRCHMALHCRKRHPDAFELYVHAIRCGWRFAPLAARDTMKFFASFSKGAKSWPDMVLINPVAADGLSWFDRELWDQTWKEHLTTDPVQEGLIGL